jgi:hypothetical protein
MGQPDEKTFQIVFARFLDFLAFDVNVIENQLFPGDQLLQIEPQ